MRLTLRTLLAYLDETLDPAQAADIEHQIKTTEVAPQLIERVQRVQRMRNLKAPSVRGKGPGADANLVAEYLDNTIDAQRISEFEKQCLESDIQLAEVAASHQVLALVLSQPAEVDVEARRRMYTLVNRLEANVSPPASADDPIPLMNGSSAEHDLLTPPPRIKPEVPEYLREAPLTQRASSYVIGAGLLALLAVAIWFSIRPPWGNGPNADVATNNAAQTPLDNGDEAANETDANRDQNGDASSGASLAESEATPESGLDLPEEDATPIFDNAEGDTPESEEGADVAAPPSPELSETESEGASDAEMPEEGATVETDAQGVVPPLQPGMESPEAKSALGRYTSQQAVLLKEARNGVGWSRMESGSQVMPGDTLISLATYRNTIALAAGVNLELVGAAQAQVLPASAEGESITLDIRYGRLVVQALGAEKTTLRLLCGGHEMLLELDTANSMVGIEVESRFVEGNDPIEEPQPALVRFWSESGAASLAEVGGGKTELRPGEVLSPSWQADAGSVPFQQLPDWLTSEVVSAIDKRASLALEEYLVTEKPIRVGLLELAGHRRPELRTLAVRSLFQLGEFQSIESVLNDTEQRANWGRFIQSIRQVMARDTAMAEGVLSELTRLRGERGQELYALLCGYTPEQLTEGEDRKLVEYLDHEDLDFRVLSIHNLRELTGVELGYRPEHTAAERKASLVKWRRRLSDGQIGPASKAPAAEEARTGVRARR